MVKDFLEIKLATRKDMGLKTTTTRVIQGLMLSIKPMVPRMVTLLVNTWDKAQKQAVGKLINIRDDPADQISGGVAVHIGQGSSWRCSKAWVRKDRTIR